MTWWLLLVGCRGPTATPEPTTTPEPVPTTPAPAPVVVVAVRPVWDPLARQLELTLTEPGPAVVACRDGLDPEGERHLVEATDIAAEHTLLLNGLRPLTRYLCRAAIPDHPAPPAEFAFTTAALDGVVPEVEVTGDATGYVLTAYKPDACSQTTWLMLLDVQGDVRWRWALPDGLQVDVEALWHDGQVVWGGGRRVDGAGVVDLVDGEVHRVQLPGDHPIHHDAKRLDDGRILTLESRAIELPGQSFEGFGLRLHDPDTGQVDWEYHSRQALDEGVLSPGFVDPWHANWVDRYDTPDGPMHLVSLCFTSQVLAISETTSEVMWVFGEDGDFTLTEGTWPGCQHGLEYDGSQLLVYDNGLFTGESAAVLYTLDPAAGTATETWRWTEPGWFEETLGDVDWLEEGTVLITRAHPECWSLGSPGAFSELIEIDPTTDAEKWRMTFTEVQDTVYRAERIDGCAAFANVAQCETIAARWDTVGVALWEPDVSSAR